MILVGYILGHRIFHPECSCFVFVWFFAIDCVNQFLGQIEETSEKKKSGRPLS